MRLGVGKPVSKERGADHVLNKFGKRERAEIDVTLRRSRRRGRADPHRRRRSRDDQVQRPPALTRCLKRSGPRGPAAASNSRCRTRFVGCGPASRRIVGGKRAAIVGSSTKLASTQLGLVTYSQLQAAGVTRYVIRRLVHAGALVVVRRHVYAVAGVSDVARPIRPRAVLAGGKQAFASHETAAQLLGLPLPGPARLEVTTRYERCPELPGVELHRTGVLDERDVSVVRAIPSRNCGARRSSTSRRDFRCTRLAN